MKRSLLSRAVAPDLAARVVGVLCACLVLLGPACGGSKGKADLAKDAGIGTPDGAAGEVQLLAADTASGATDGPGGGDAWELAALTDAGDTSGDGAEPMCTAFPDPCAAFMGATFRSTSWGTLSFGQQNWVWKFSDAGESGRYVCKDGMIEATSLGGAKHPAAIVGPDCNTVKWDKYGPFQLNGARDPNAPEPVL